MTYQLDPTQPRARVAPSTRTRTTGAPHFGTLPLGDPTGGADGIRWREQVDGKQLYPRVVIDRNVSITMSDGVVLRATVIRPANRFGQTILTPYPAVININPYNRAAIDFIDQTLHAPVLGKALHTASRSMDAHGPRGTHDVDTDPVGRRLRRLRHQSQPGTQRVRAGRRRRPRAGPGVRGRDPAVRAVARVTCGPSRDVPRSPGGQPTGRGNAFVPGGTMA